MIFGPRRAVAPATTSIASFIITDADCIVACEASYGLYTTSARTTLVTSNGDPVGSWTDQSTFANHFSQATSGQRPTYVASGHNSLPAVADDASSQLGMTGAADFTSHANISIFVVYKSASTGNARAIRGNPNNWLLGPRSSNVNYYAGGFAGTVAYTTNQAIIHYVEQSSSQGDHYVNGTIVGGGGVGSPTSPGTFSLMSPGAGEPLNGQIQCVIGYKRKLNSTDRKAVESWLGTRYSISTPP